MAASVTVEDAAADVVASAAVDAAASATAEDVEDREVVAHQEAEAAVAAPAAASQDWVQRAARSTFWFVLAQLPTLFPNTLTNASTQEPHRHAGVFVARGKEDLLVTKNLVPGESVYGEKRITIESSGPASGSDEAGVTKTEYRVWNPFRSKLAAGILGGLDNIYMRPGAKVLYLGAASGTSVSHVSDIVGPTGVVYAIEFSHRSGRDLVGLATKRTNIIPIVEDARHPLKYRMLVGMVDCVFADVAQPDQARIVGMNAHLFLKQGGGVLISIKANCIDSTKPAEQVFALEVNKMRQEMMKPKEQLTLEPFERDHCVVAAEYIHTKEA